MAIPRTIIPVLRQHLSEYVKAEDDALITTGARGGILRRSNFRRAVKWAEITEKIGAKGLHFHDLRHTGNHLAAGSGQVSATSCSGWATTPYAQR